jgi:hypothetical protein
MKHKWRWRQFVHSLFGIGALVLTLIGAIIILKFVNWNFYVDHFHNVAGAIYVLVAILLGSSGIYLLIFRKFSNFEWSSYKLQQRIRIHKTFGYSVLISIQAVLVSGIYRYGEVEVIKSLPIVCAVAFNLVCFIGILIFGEIRH